MNCANHPNVAASHYCRTCGKPLCSACSRDVMGVIYCEQCLADRLQGVQPPPPQPGAASVPAAGFVSSSTSYAPPPPGVQVGVNGPNPALAGILSAILPFGVGAVYCGQYVKGLVHLGIAVFLIVAQSSDVPWYMHVFLGISMGFYYVYQIVDSVRTAHAISAGQPAPDPFGFGQVFGPVPRRSESASANIPTAAIILIVLGGLFLLNTTVGIDLRWIWPLFMIALGAWMFARRWGLIPPGYSGCQCDRCRTRGLMGPAVIMAVGVMWLLDEMGRTDWGHSWPILLIVIGVIKIIQNNASTNGHVDYLPKSYPPGGPTPPQSPVTPAAPPSSEVTNG